MKRIFIMLLTVSMIGIYGCSKHETKTKLTKAERVVAKKTNAQVKAEMDILLTEVEANWNTMISSDDQKIDNLHTLLAKIGKTKNYDKTIFQEISTANNELKAKRYDRLGVSDIAAVDSYDSVQIKVMDVTNQLLEASNLSKTDTMATWLSAKIQEDDNRVPILRGYYDKAAKSFNQFLKDYQPQVQKLGQPYNSMQPLPLFVEQPLL